MEQRPADIYYDVAYQLQQMLFDELKNFSCDQIRSKLTEACLAGCAKIEKHYYQLDGMN